MVVTSLSDAQFLFVAYPRGQHPVQRLPEAPPGRVQRSSRPRPPRRLPALSVHFIVHPDGVLQRRIPARRAERGRDASLHPSRLLPPGGCSRDASHVVAEGTGVPARPRDYPPRLEAGEHPDPREQREDRRLRSVVAEGVVAQSFMHPLLSCRAVSVQVPHHLHRENRACHLSFPLCAYSFGELRAGGCVAVFGRRGY